MASGHCWWWDVCGQEDRQRNERDGRPGLPARVARGKTCGRRLEHSFNLAATNDTAAAGLTAHQHKHSADLVVKVTSAPTAAQITERSVPARQKKAINCEYAKTVHWFESRKQWMVVVLCFCLSHMPITLWWGLDKHQRKDGRKITQATDCVAYGVCGYVCVCVLCVFWRI